MIHAQRNCRNMKVALLHFRRWETGGGEERCVWPGTVGQHSLQRRPASGTFSHCILCSGFLETWEKWVWGGQRCCCIPTHIAAHYPIPFPKPRDNPGATPLLPTWHITETKHPFHSLLSHAHNSERKQPLTPLYRWEDCGSHKLPN